MSTLTTAVIADIHGNLPALEAVLADMQRFDVNGLLCLGDVANLGPAPSATLKRLRARAAQFLGNNSTGNVLGNTDDYLLRPRTLADVADPDEHTPKFLDLERWCAEQLDAEDREFIATFQPRLKLELAGLPVVAYHGSPANYDDQIRATTEDETLDAYCAGYPAGLYLGAHTHEQFARRYRASVVANPGSVGAAFVVPPGAKSGRYVPHAEYAVLQVVDGLPNIELRRVPYDPAAYREAVLASGMPHQEWWLAKFA